MFPPSHGPSNPRLHHVGVRDVAHELAKEGICLLEEQSIRGAGQFLCNFLAPVHTRGVIVEYIEELD